MIKLLRVDHRLLHGQVAFSWTQFLGVDCILIANDGLMHDELRKTTIKLAKPQGVKVVMKNIQDSIDAINSGVTDKYKLFVVVESIEDANRLVKGTDKFDVINLGGIKAREGTKNISKAINITQEEEETLKELINSGVTVEIRQIPNDQKILAENVLN
ncbi:MULTISPECIES: PTS sugar transporter subunit IIB [unclassified Romboutsia]|uniref:PTS sugar transporter subunit IIB n=1 Tax=unclassified Romboutsia TaxID=2626894 RepID=UPI000821293D|nr:MULTISPECIES: PTS sugar transporter subunit IIB [unclassified Romboutsia]SCI04473.1 EIIAB-Man [uncultured Clostridium sp.]